MSAPRSWPAAISATDALRAQILRSAAVCSIGAAAAAEACGISHEGMRSWQQRWFGTAAWPPDVDALEELLALPVEFKGGTLGPVGRLSQIAEALTGQAPGSIAGKSRVRPVVRARQAVCWAIRGHYGENWSYPMIGRALGGRDHSTVIHAIRSAEIFRARDPDYAALCDLLLVHAASSAPLLIQRARALPEWALSPSRWLAQLAADPVEVDEDAAAVEVGPRSGTWCAQCDALVGAERLAACRDRFCSLRAAEQPASSSAAIGRRRIAA